MLHRRDLANRRRAVARFADSLLNDKRFDDDTAAALLEVPVGQWRDVWERRRPQNPTRRRPGPLRAANGPSRTSTSHRSARH